MRKFVTRLLALIRGPRPQPAKIVVAIRNPQAVPDHCSGIYPKRKSRVRFNSNGYYEIIES